MIRLKFFIPCSVLKSFNNRPEVISYYEGEWARGSRDG